MGVGIFASYLMIGFIVVSASVKRNPITPDFVAKRVLNDGEVERRVFKRGISSVETTAFGVNSTSVRLRQVSDGKHLIQIILDSNNKIIDCEYSRDEEDVDNFYAGFQKVNARARALFDDGLVVEVGPGVNDSLKLVGSNDDDKEFSYKKLKKECKRTHEKMKESAKRARRKTRDLFIYPGTNWCGIGAMTEKYNELGFNAAADRCCRQHDYCPHVIEGFTSKYHLFNYRFHTLSHCDCDERFRTCLKMVNNAASNMVGKLFFNIVSMRCFILKSEKTCVRRSWWGKCLKYEMNKVAHLRDALHF